MPIDDIPENRNKNSEPVSESAFLLAKQSSVLNSIIQIERQRSVFPLASILLMILCANNTLHHIVIFDFNFFLV
jgi:hypothetical protein